MSCRGFGDCCKFVQATSQKFENEKSDIRFCTLSAERQVKFRIKPFLKGLRGSRGQRPRVARRNGRNPRKKDSESCPFCFYRSKEGDEVARSRRGVGNPAGVPHSQKRGLGKNTQGLSPTKNRRRSRPEPSAARHDPPLLSGREAGEGVPTLKAPHAHMLNTYPRQTHCLISKEAVHYIIY